VEIKEIISYGCHNGSNQQFAYKKGSKQIIIKSSKKCLDVTKRNAIEERNRKNGNIMEKEKNIYP
jgi:hypothetical protein